MSMVVVLPEPLPRDGGAKKFCRDPTVRSGPEVKNGRSSAKDGMPEKLRCKTVQREVKILQMSLQTLQEDFSFRFILHRQEDKRRL